MFDRAVIARHADSLVRPETVAERLLVPVGLQPGAVLGEATVARFELEGDHLRFDLAFAGGPRDLAILVRPRDEAQATYLRTTAWNVSYRGQDFSRADEGWLRDVGERLDRAAARLGLDAAGLLAAFFTRPDKDDFLEISPGKKLYVRVIEHCDEACLFCNATEGNSNIVESRQSVEEILRGLPVGALRQVIFSGGEPTLVKSLPHLVGLACERGATDVIVQTNGVALAAPGALEAYLPWQDRLGIGFSLHASDPALSALLIDRPDLSRHPAKIRAIDRAIELGFRVKITCVVMRPNLAQVPAFAQWCWDRWGLGLHRLQFSYAMPRGNAWLNQHLLVRFDECVAPFAAAFEIGRRTGLAIETSQTACVPPCVMPDYVAHFDCYGDFSGRVSDPERVKPEACRGCAWDRICAGVWQRYVDVFGTSELRPVRDRPLPPVEIVDYLESEIIDLSPC